MYGIVIADFPKFRIYGILRVYIVDLDCGSNSKFLPASGQRPGPLHLDIRVILLLWNIRLVNSFCIFIKIGGKIPLQHGSSSGCIVIRIRSQNLVWVLRNLHRLHVFALIAVFCHNDIRLLQRRQFFYFVNNIFVKRLGTLCLFEGCRQVILP